MCCSSWGRKELDTTEQLNCCLEVPEPSLSLKLISVLAWRIPGTGEPGWLPSMGRKELDMTEKVIANVDCQPHGLQHARLPSPLLSPGICSNSNTLS